MLVDRTYLIERNRIQMNYGAAVTDIDQDGQFEVLVAGFQTTFQPGAPNIVLKWTGETYRDIADSTLADAGRQAIGVAAGDIDGNGREEVYILNTDTFGGPKTFGDRLLAANENSWTDLFSLPMNRSALNMTAGRSVGCIDRYGSGRYGFFVANYGGRMRFYELNEDGALEDVATRAGLDQVTGGRSVLALPLISKHMDIFVGNEQGANFLFVNTGDGTFQEQGERRGITDLHQNARGVAAVDMADSGPLGVVCGNWEGPHRLYRRRGVRFEDIAPEALARPSRLRTVIVADFDNDGYEEIFFNNMGQPNRLFRLTGGEWVEISPGAAVEENGLGTGGAVGDLDGDGILELVIAHGETGAQPLTLYKGRVPAGYHYLRVLPLTRYGAPARGALVRLWAGGRRQTRAIDAGSGYLCQMEPVAHFGLGPETTVERVEVTWLDGEKTVIHESAADQLLRVPHPLTRIDNLFSQPDSL